MKCAGASTAHCCWVDGVPCPNLRDDGPDMARRWVCTLREAHGNWDDTITDPAYRPVGDHWVSVGQPFNYCQSFMAPCNACVGAGV